MNLFAKIFGTKRARDVKKLRPYVEIINKFDEQYKSLSDDELRAKTQEFKDRLKNGETLDDIMCEAFAVVKNACRRMCGNEYEVCGHKLKWEMVPFDVQLMGGIVLHQGKIAEMQTGEGKTLVATLPLYLNALSGNNVHLVTVNDYLALRDSQWVGQVFKWLGLTVGCIQNTMNPMQRREQYACDVTYGTNSEFGFDYLRDNGMATSAVEQVQRGYTFAIIDEVDSILIDEARTPLIISGPAPQTNQQYSLLQPKVERLYRKQSQLVEQLFTKLDAAIKEENRDASLKYIYQIFHAMPKHHRLLQMFEDPQIRKIHEDVENMMLTEMHKEDARKFKEELFFTIDERTREAILTDNGCTELNPADHEMFVLPDIVAIMSAIDAEGLSNEERQKKRQEAQADFAERSERIHTIDQLLKAYCLYEKDTDYVVMDNKVLIVDEFTGRILPGRRWSDGLHQAVEAKEGVKIERETQTLATITIQNYFRMYKKLAGMTGTAETEASEFNEIYRLDVVVIPTNRPIRRVDSNDLMYRTQREKYNAIIEEVKECHRNGQPVLLGTVAVETSEILSRLFKQAGIPHNVLNAKNHAREAEIVALAGQPGAVTIATNMAGRGTDIKLGEGVVWTPRELIHSQTSLEDKPEGNSKTLRELLEERPCGLRVIGSERHESRRIDRQLRGRCARQGDPGSSRFYVSLEDPLMRLFGSDRISGLMLRLGYKEGEAIQAGLLNRSIETAQRKVEQRNFSIRKRTLEYDDVMNRQREVIYGFRSDALSNENVHELILDIFNDIVLTQCEKFIVSAKDSRIGELVEWVNSVFPVPVSESDLEQYKGDSEGASKHIMGLIEEAYKLKCSMETPERLKDLERYVMIRSVDTEWQTYLRSIDDLRSDVRLRSYAQRDPLVEYKREASIMFYDLMERIKLNICTAAFRSATSLEAMQGFMIRMASSRRLKTNNPDAENSILAEAAAAQAGANERAARVAQANRVSASNASADAFSKAMAVAEKVRAERAAGGGDGANKARGPIKAAPSVGRNDPCPCGSGKKYKKCCGAN